jgi:Uma2 family endonuclease
MRYAQSMPAGTALSVEQYLATSFPDLDREYWDGELVERSLPDTLHSKTQGLVAGFFVAVRGKLPVHAYPELRLRIRPKLILIPDVSVYYPDEPKERFPERPPLITIEILSLDDRLKDVREKLEIYRNWGVPHVWLVDPHSRRMYTCEGNLMEVPALQVPELGLTLTATEVFG